ncbi:hypothetical protein Q5P01_000759 [Channa striata]|uniref:DNA-directed DNA polymerase n=1 Tax=Channa striata TaxID=64152 RepID=A0AA88IH60_CHASR|nr:hypothetical protein Q5P01_000759 [Channa striata]
MIRSEASVIVPVSAGMDLTQFQDLLDRTIQSNFSVLTDPSLELVVQVVQNPRGGTKRLLHKMLDREILKKKRKTLYIIENQDNQLCFAINLAHLIYPNITDSEAEIRGRGFQSAVGLSDRTLVCFTDIEKFERKLNIFQTSTPRKNEPLFMFLHENHYYGIKNPKAFIGSQYFCMYCYKGYTDKLCEGHCNVCFTTDCRQGGPSSVQSVVCGECNRRCASELCLTRHRELDQLPLPQIHKKCPKCSRLYYIPQTKAGKPHKCQESKCHICGDVMNKDDNLYFVSEKKLIFYDFETYPDKKGVHMAFYVSVETGNGEKWDWWGVDCCVKFLLHFRTRRYQNAVLLAHNSRGFDGHVIVKTMISLGIMPEMPDFGLRFIDSAAFLPFPLATLPKAMGFEDAVKGYFPHKFSSENTLDYVGPYPEAQCYGADQMSVKNRELFMLWYICHGKFDFKKEAILYCKNDTAILRKACLLFREMLIKETGFDPFKRVTIASACMYAFRTNFLLEKTLAIPCPYDYRFHRKRFSDCSIQWLEYVMSTQNVFIQHALNTGEKSFGPWQVDGYYELNGEHHVFEFLQAVQATECVWCELNMQSDACSHSEEERALTGVWITPEVLKALEKGYRLVETHEVWHFKERSNTLFREYIQTFLKGKQEASGYPSNVTDEAGRQKYIQEYHEKQGILLDASKIQSNPAKRQVAKLCWNSFCDKFAQNMIQTELVSDPAAFFSLMFSATHEVKYFNFLNENLAMIQYYNVFIAAFTTGHARLKLYSHMEQLERRVLYYDTDSLIYTTRQGETPLPLGNYLGDLTDELNSDSIKEFVSASPKSYAYQTRQGKVEMKVKGIKQSFECCKNVIDSVKSLVENYIVHLGGVSERVLEAPQHNIGRDKKTFQLRNTLNNKRFRVVFDKRRLLTDGTSLPFGYQLE